MEKKTGMSETMKQVADRKPILYVDMDNTIVNFMSGVGKFDAKLREEYRENPDDIPHVFAMMDEIEGAVDAVRSLMDVYDVYILSTAPWKNPTSLDDKKEWLKRHFGECIRKRAIFTHRKDLCIGDFLVDDSPKNGAREFRGEWIQIGSERFPDWKAIKDYLMKKAGN